MRYLLGRFVVCLRKLHGSANVTQCTGATKFGWALKRAYNHVADAIMLVYSLAEVNSFHCVQPLKAAVEAQIKREGVKVSCFLLGNRQKNRTNRASGRLIKYYFEVSKEICSKFIDRASYSGYAIIQSRHQSWSSGRWSAGRSGRSTLGLGGASGPRPKPKLKRR